MKCINCPLMKDTSMFTDDTEEYGYECWVGELPNGEGCTRTNKWILAQDVKKIEDKHWKDEAKTLEKYAKEQGWEI